MSLNRKQARAWTSQQELCRRISSTCIRWPYKLCHLATSMCGPLFSYPVTGNRNLFWGFRTDLTCSENSAEIFGNLASFHTSNIDAWGSIQVPDFVNQTVIRKFYWTQPVNSYNCSNKQTNYCDPCSSWKIDSWHPNYWTLITKLWRRN